MTKSMSAFFGFLCILFVVILIYGSWKLERNINYRWAYQNQVLSEIQKAIKPLEARITVLESQIKTNR